jgi:PAS domain S-box-containing protein
MLRTPIKVIRDIWTASIQRQLILGIALVHAILMTIFVIDLVERQTNFLHQQSIEQATSLAETLAANSTSWVLANDIIGIEEVIASQSKYPSLKYAMLLNLEGKVLGHTDKKHVGKYANDAKSKALLKVKRAVQKLSETQALIDIAAPILANDQQIGWARVGLGQDKNIAGLRIITRDGVLYTLIAIVVGIVFAVLMAKGLTLGLCQLVNVSSRIRQGEHDIRVDLQRNDEIGQLGTDFNQMLDSLSSVRAELAISEERFDLAMRGANDGLWDWNMLTNEVYFSPRWKAMVGYKDEELENQFSTFEKLIHPDDYDRVMQMVEDYINGKVNTYEVEFRMHHKEAHWEYILARGYVMRDNNGQPIRMTGTHVDITERKLAEEQILKLNSELEDRVEQRTSELVSAKEEAERANTAKSEFLSRMSHELRTPMNAILGFSQLLESDTRQPLTEDQHESVTEILNAGSHLLELINEVLDLARIEAGKITVSIEPVLIRESLNECLSLVKPLADEREITIVEADSNNNNYVLADRTRLKQVLLNLLSNAVKYNEHKGQVKISYTNMGNDLQISVADTGPGLTVAEQERLFIPFDQGTGIGLALSKRLIECMNGDIGVESPQESGSVFWIKLPVATVMPVDHKQSDSTAMLEASAKSLYRYQILYIEDNPANTRLIQRILSHSRKDILLVTTCTPKEGLELAQTQKPDLILLDINLPDMDGYDVLKCLQVNSDTQNIPVVGISTNAMPKDIAHSKAAGFNDYLTKPIDMVKFIAVIDGILDK